MILEVAVLNIIPEKESEFEQSFKQASPIIASIPGYINHDLQKCLETDNRYLLLVYWQTLEAHTVNFRQSSQYQEWSKLLHHFYQPFPEVEHYYSVLK